MTVISSDVQASEVQVTTEVPVGGMQDLGRYGGQCAVKVMGGFGGDLI